MEPETNIHRREQNRKGVSAGIAIFESDLHINNIQRRVNKSCTNNQAQQLAILTALKHTENMQTTDKTVTIYTDSLNTRLTENGNIHTYLIEEIRKHLNEMTTKNWKINLRWVETHAVVRENELARKLAKQATANKTLI